MNNVSQFSKKDNMNLLWDVLLDELHITSDNISLISNIKTVFESNINPFTSRANKNAKIMELNKQFLSQVVLAVNRIFPQLKNEQNIKKITITNEEVFEPYKIEDIHASRQSNFEKEVERKRTDLENYMTPQKPSEPDFSYGNLDEKIKSMDSLIADKLSQRNLEIEQFQNSNYNTSGIHSEQWLKPKETSVKAEKINLEQTNTNNRFKHINIENNIQLNTNDTKLNKIQKNVSWDDNVNINVNLEEPISNIFQKLKRNNTIQDIELINELTTENKQYVEQKSIPLPDVKQEQININTQQNIVSQTVPIIPKNELIKQLNEMNTKIDSLYDIINKLNITIQDLLVNKNSDNIDINIIHDNNINNEINKANDI
jgi:hypothetical protein